MLKAQTFSFTIQSPAELDNIVNPLDIRVYTGTEFTNISVPQTIKADLNSGKSTDLNITWLKGNYNNGKTGTYKIYGEVKLPPGIINPHQLKGQLNIMVRSHSSGGSGSSGIVKPNMTIKSDGGSVKKDGNTIEVPSGAVNEDIKIEIQKVDTQNVTIAPRSRLIGDVIEISKNQSDNFKKPVKISLSFNKSGVDTDKYQLSLFWLNEKNNQWIELDNVKVDIKNGTVSGDVEHFTKFAILAVEKNDIFITRNLSDIKGHWTEDYINSIVEKGIASGDAAGTFRPDANISREEFCKLIVLAADLTPVEKAELKFNDKNHIAPWARPYVTAAVNAGIINGYGDQSFKPQRNITRAEIAAMVMRTLDNKSEKTSVGFNDASTIPDWALSSVAQTVDSQIINGFPDNTFRAADPATRAQGAKIITQMIKN